MFAMFCIPTLRTQPSGICAQLIVVHNCRDVAPRIGFLKPALIESRFFPALQVRWPSSASVAYSANEALAADAVHQKGWQLQIARCCDCCSQAAVVTNTSLLLHGTGKMLASIPTLSIF